MSKPSTAFRGFILRRFTVAPPSSNILADAQPSMRTAIVAVPYALFHDVTNDSQRRGLCFVFRTLWELSVGLVWLRKYAWIAGLDRVITARNDRIKGDTDELYWQTNDAKGSQIAHKREDWRRRTDKKHRWGKSILEVRRATSWCHWEPVKTGALEYEIRLR